MKERIILMMVNYRLDPESYAYQKTIYTDLIAAAQGDLILTVEQKLNTLNARTLIGQGKVEELKELVMEYAADTVLISEALTGSQLRNLEETIGVKVVDKVMLILDIFALRAKSNLGKLHVRLAQLNYKLPRLSMQYGALSRTGGGIGTRGPGETQLENDRRHILRAIHKLRQDIAKQEASYARTRKKRQDSLLPYIVLVGFTNVGKSTILNALLQSEDKRVYADDQVFATLDPSVRRIVLNEKETVMLSDTVGFIADLPKQLEPVFKATLLEIEDADLIVHVIDVSDRNAQIHIDTTLKTLNELHIEGIPVLTVFNKIDKEHHDYDFLQVPPAYQDFLYMSARNPEDIKKLKDKLADMLKGENKY